MKKVVVLLTCLLVLAVAAVASAAVGPSVTVQIKSTHKTLLSKKHVHGSAGWITKGGTPRGKCPGNSAAGALTVATHGRWTGKYYASVGGIFVTSILNVKPSGKSFWEVLVNNRPSSKGICAIKLRAGERLQFKLAK